MEPISILRLPIVGSLAKLAVPLFKAPVRIEVLDGRDRQSVIRKQRIQALTIPRWIPYPNPPSPDLFDAGNLHLSIEDVAREKGWLPAERDRIALEITNTTSGTLRFKRISAEAKPAAVGCSRDACSVFEISVGGAEVEIFGIRVTLSSGRGCEVVEHLEVNPESVTRYEYRLRAGESVAILVDAFVGLGEEAEKLDWRLKFDVEAQQGVRRRRSVRFPGRFAKPLQIVNASGFPRYLTSEVPGGFTWQRQ